MRLITTIVTTFLIFSQQPETFGQAEYSYWSDIDVRRLQNSEFTPPKGVKEAHYEYTGGNNTSLYVRKYNDQGLLTEVLRSKNGKALRKVGVFIYDIHSRLLRVDFFKKGELNYSKFYEYDLKGNLVSLTNKNPKGIIIDKLTWEYTDKGCITKSVSYGKNEKLRTSMEYEYYDSCRKSHSVLYNRNGKIKEEWDFMCTETGEKKKKNDLNLICLKHESTSEFLIQTYQSIDAKGKSYRYVAKYTIEDTLILEWTNYNHKNQMMVHYTYDKSFDKMLSTTYYKNGKVDFENKITYSGNQIKTRETFRNGKAWWYTEYFYNKIDELIGKRSTRNGKVKSEMTVTYVR
jgi:antitoxin component YwqK of YwqJK toxin-antitoxin module